MKLSQESIDEIFKNSMERFESDPIFKNIPIGPMKRLAYKEWRREMINSFGEKE